MYEYEKRLQEELMRVIEANKPTNLFDFGVQLGYLHAIARATVTGKSEGLAEEMKMQRERTRSE